MLRYSKFLCLARLNDNLRVVTSRDTNDKLCEAFLFKLDSLSILDGHSATRLGNATTHGERKGLTRTWLHPAGSKPLSLAFFAAHSTRPRGSFEAIDFQVVGF